MTYNGWYNYETWLTNLHFDNFFDFFKEAAEDHVFEDMDAQDIQSYIADFIEQSVRDYVDETAGENSPFITDMINSFLGDVEFNEIAEHYLEDVLDKLEQLKDTDD